MATPASLLASARVAALTGVAVWGWYIAAMSRTSTWGYDNLPQQTVASLWMFSVFALPLALLALIGLPKRRRWITLLILTLGCVGSAEVFARSQEYRLIRRLGGAPTTTVQETRWWPFQNHSIGARDGHWWGCD